jgi:hypothetical protein
MLVRGGVLSQVLICVCLLLTFDNLPFMHTTSMHLLLLASCEA